MKRIFLILNILIPLSCLAGTPPRTVSPTRVAAVVSSCRLYDGVEVIKLGRVGTAFLKGASRLAAIGEPEVREFLHLMKDIRSIAFMDYDSCSSSDKASISRKLERVLEGSDLLMEVNDAGEKMMIYGVADDSSDKVREFVLFSPSDCMLMCVFGTISMDALAKLAFND